jgi:hypothetical protein
MWSSRIFPHHDVGGGGLGGVWIMAPVFDEPVELDCQLVLLDEETDQGKKGPVLNAKLRNRHQPHPAQFLPKSGLPGRLRAPVRQLDHSPTEHRSGADDMISRGRKIVDGQQVAVQSRVRRDKRSHLPIAPAGPHDGRAHVDDPVDGLQAVASLVNRQTGAAPELAGIEPGGVHLSQVGGEDRQAEHHEPGVMASHDGAFVSTNDRPGSEGVLSPPSLPG